jgi:hypothetical protein
MRAIATRAAAAGGGGGDGGGGGRRGRRGESVGANVGEACTLAVATQQIPKKKKLTLDGLEHPWPHSQAPVLTTLIAAHLHGMTN